MTEKTPQEEMAEKISKQTRKRAGKLVEPTMSDAIKARKEPPQKGTSRREMMAAMRSTVGRELDSRGGKTIKKQRHANLAQTASKRAPQKHPYAIRSNK